MPCAQGPFAGTEALWAEAEYDGAFAFADGSRFEGLFRGLCPLRGFLTDARGRRWRVGYSGDAWLAAGLQPVTKEVSPALKPRVNAEPCRHVLTAPQQSRGVRASK
jgi:hypothetical protein